MGAFALLPPPNKLGKATSDRRSTLVSGFFGGPAEGGAMERQELLRGGSLGRDIPDAGVYAIAVFILMIIVFLIIACRYYCTTWSLSSFRPG